MGFVNEKSFFIDTEIGGFYLELYEKDKKGFVKLKHQTKTIGIVEINIKDLDILAIIKYPFNIDQLKSLEEYDRVNEKEADI